MAAGDYTVNIFDQMGDSLVRNVTLIGPGNELDAQISNMTTVNNGLITGGLNAMVNGGVPPYSYVWKKDGNVLTNTWSYLSVSQTGTYSLVVTDATSGMDSATVVVSLPEDTTMEAAAPPAWGMYGNAGNGDILEGEGAPWFGTADSTDVVMKANGVPQLRLGANGVTSVEGQLRLANLQEAALDSTEPQFRLMVADENGVLATAGGDYFPFQPNPCKYALGGHVPYWDNGVNRIFVDDCYGQVNVGIGTEQPQTRLHVVGNTLNTGNIRTTTLSVNTDDVLARITVKGGISQSGKALEVQDNEGNGALRVYNNGDITIGPYLTQTNQSATLYLGDDRQHYIRSTWNEGLSFSTYGAVDAMVIQEGTGSVGLGATPVAGYRLAIKGKMISEGFKVRQYADWPDFVFSETYYLMPLDEVKAHIKEKGHLPGMPSQAQVASDGFELESMTAMLLEKIEELTLHLIRMQEELDNCKK